MVYKVFNELKKVSKKFLRKSLDKNVKKEENQKKEISLFKKIISTSLVIAGSVSIIFFINFQHNINYSKNLVQSVPIQKIHKKSKIIISHNWSGYVVASNFKDPKPVVKSVAGEWKVPNIQYTKSNHLSNKLYNSFISPNGNTIWVGIGGQFKKDNTLIQTGILSYYSHNSHSIVNKAWYELIPNGEQIIPNFHVKIGDEIYAKIVLLNKKQNKWEIKLDNLTENESFEKIVTYKSSMLSAEWIIECPLEQKIILANILIGNQKQETFIPIFIVSKLDNFKSFEFKSVMAKINSITKPIGFLSYEKIGMFVNKNKVTLLPSKISGHGLDFRIKDLN